MVFTLFAMVLVALHFFLTIAYTFRENVSYPVAAAADNYAIPLFHQNWKLFAPDPAKYNAELEYRYARASAWSDWNDASAAFGFGNASRVETIEQGFNSSLGWQVVNNFYTKDGRAQYDRLVSSPSYVSALYFVMRMHNRFKQEESMDSIQVRLKFRFTPAPEMANTFQTSVLDFPIYALEK